MQPYSTTDYIDHELLTSVQQYRQEVRMLPTLSPEEEAALVKLAREGDAQAKEALLESCVRYVALWARRYADAYGWQSARIEEEELIGVGNVTLVEVLERALDGDHPIGYLQAAAKREMARCCYYRRSLIKTPCQGTYADIPVASLDAPLDEDGVTLAEMIASSVEDPLPQRSFDALYQAMAHLTENQRDVLSRSYGLGESVQESPCEIERRKQVCRRTLNDTIRGAVARLHVLMPSPDTALEVSTSEQAAQRLGMTKMSFFNYVSSHGVKAAFPRTNMYGKAEIERLAQERAAKRRGAVCDTSGCEQDATSFDSEAVEFRCDEHVEVQA